MLKQQQTEAAQRSFLYYQELFGSDLRGIELAEVESMIAEMRLTNPDAIRRAVLAGGMRVRNMNLHY